MKKVLIAICSSSPLFGHTINRNLLLSLIAVSFSVSVVLFPIVAKPCPFSDAETRAGIGVLDSTSTVTPNIYKHMLLTLRHDLRARKISPGHCAVDTYSYNDIASRLPTSLLRLNHLPLNVN